MQLPPTLCYWITANYREVLIQSPWHPRARPTMASGSGPIPPTSFSTAFNHLSNSVTKDDARAFSTTTMQDVWTAVKDIEHHLESRRSLRGFNRIRPFLTGIEQYSKVIEVVCNGTPYLSYIWVGIDTPRRCMLTLFRRRSSFCFK